MYMRKYVRLRVTIKVSFSYMKFVGANAGIFEYVSRYISECCA